MGLREDVEELKIILQNNKAEEVVEKKFKFPFGKKVGKSQRKKNYVTVLIINENGSYDFKKYQIEDQVIMHDLIPRIATSGHCIFDNKGNPLIILPNWSVEPFSPLAHNQASLINGSNTSGYKLLMAEMKKNIIKGKKQMSGTVKWIAGAGFLGIIVYALLTS